MPQRFLRPQIRTSPRWNAISHAASRLYIAILTQADDYGRHDGRVSVLWSEAFAVWNEQNPDNIVSVADCAELCAQLIDAKLAEFYEIDGRRYVQLTQWQERARGPSRWPEPTNGSVDSKILRNPAESCGALRNPAESCLLSPSPSPSPSHTPRCAHPPSFSRESAEVLQLLNEQTGRKFRPIEANLNPIRCRFAEEGVTLDGVKQMILRQVALWRGDAKMEQYLRPETLFAKSKFDSYYSARELPVLREQGKPAAPVLVGSLSAAVGRLMRDYARTRDIPNKDLLPVVQQIDKIPTSERTPNEQKLWLEQRAHRDAL